MIKEKLPAETLDFEIEFYEKLLKKNPDETTILIPLGNAYTERGLHEKGLSVDKKLVSLKQDEPIFYYNLACSFSLLKKQKEAVEALSKALELGYRDFEHMKIDHDLDNIRGDGLFKALLKKHKKSGSVK
ncbi:MAG: hypothetical protein U9Q24_04750 [Candidatus Ratteibacteria bacterium]|nr:hypothetical protein [Candidatus Ratteibacteria bacterium]